MHLLDPSARKCCYEVQEDFVRTLKNKGISEKFFSRSSDRITFSLQELAVEKLKRYGIEEIYDISFCTICSERFFSYRNGDFEERILTMAWLED
ncbi:MAG: laccase domain-containing protein [Persephonella sp.]|nr:laccase domain-containing protein [Persephonella sp.]